MDSRSVFIALAAAAAATSLGCAPAQSAEPPTETRQVQSIVRNTASPFCPGKTLDSCPSPKASAWRQDIHAWVAEGVPDSEIRDRLQERVPGFDLALPPVRAGWLIPLSAVALSTLWFLVMARRTRPRRRADASTARPAHRSDLDARLDRELAMLD